MSDPSHETDDTGGDHPAADADHADGDADANADNELPAEVVDEAERLTHLERAAVDDNEATAYADRREELLAEYDFTSRIRKEDDATLVCHPEEWHDDENGVIRTDRINDISRAVEIQLEGTEDPDDWAAVDAHNRDLADRVREAYGDVHGDNADTLADFLGNHYAKPLEYLTGLELSEFRTEYFVRNAWPSEEQRAAIDESIRLTYDAADESVPEYDRPSSASSRS
ncbi:rnhA operon protein [Natronolimnobius sp. AArcel1]|uniref:DUF7108 family protein n=1 Tax=Natronolimnobius sp. AArcel1 TaxID=1679093 RepID=UPI0013EA9ACA|nr:rnhA operon protein [Natronolimnobius sp. AArcel1]NGM69008.1 rnhA operon protein [Natronolimnobius sp. AArcel1]